MQLESLQAVDRWVGAIMDKLRQIGQDANTLVLFTGDNGFAWGAHCHRPKRCPYEECMRVPLIVRYPLLAPQARIDTRIGLNIHFAFALAAAVAAGAPIDPAQTAASSPHFSPVAYCERQGRVISGRTRPSLLDVR